jgi:hypothetical protein
MAKIIEENIVIRVSKLVRDKSDTTLVSVENLQALEAVAQELLGSDVIVEAVRAE